jgi:hypothetical protein
MGSGRDTKIYHGETESQHKIDRLSKRDIRRSTVADIGCPCQLDCSGGIIVYPTCYFSETLLNWVPGTLALTSRWWQGAKLTVHSKWRHHPR